jgi:hypothetical protein
VIREIERYHGAVLARLFREGGCPALRCVVHPRFRSAYVLDDSVGIYVKYSTSRLSPWMFGFKATHRREIENLCEDLQAVFIALACGFDGVACLSASEFEQVGMSESVRVMRGPRQQYAVSSARSGSRLRIAQSEFPAKVYAATRAAADR